MEKTKTDVGTEKRRVPFAEGFLTTPLTNLEEVRLLGVKCRSCGAVFFGQSKRYGCENCSSTDIQKVILSRSGKVYTYTIDRAPPRPPYVGPDPYVPFAVAWVELEEGVRVLSPLTGCDPEKVYIGMEVELVIEKGFEDEEGNEVVFYKFKPAGK